MEIAAKPSPQSPKDRQGKLTNQIQPGSQDPKTTRRWVPGERKRVKLLVKDAATGWVYDLPVTAQPVSLLVVRDFSEPSHHLSIWTFFHKQYSVLISSFWLKHEYIHTHTRQCISGVILTAKRPLSAAYGPLFSSHMGFVTFSRGMTQLSVLRWSTLAHTDTHTLICLRLLIRSYNLRICPYIRLLWYTQIGYVLS